MTSALGIGVPGTVAGLALALDKYGSGKFTLAELLKPAIALARDGFVITDDSADTLPQWHKRFERLAVIDENLFANRRQFAARGRHPDPADLAATLTAIAEQGARGFYEGAVADKLVDGIRAAGGIMTLGDLKSYAPVVREPVRGTYRGYDIVSMPLPSSGGTVLMESLNILEGFPMHDMQQGSVDFAASADRGDEARLRR